MDFPNRALCHEGPMTDPKVPEEFRPADNGLCEIAKAFDGKTNARFVAVYPAGMMIAVHDGTRVESEWIGRGDVAGRKLLDVLAAAGEAKAVVIDLRLSKCWIAPRSDAAGFVAQFSPDPKPK
jgi:hypothetical protein